MSGECIAISKDRWRESTKSWPKKLLGMLLTDFVIFIIVFTCAEIGLRLLVPELRRLVYTDTLTGGHPIKRNEYGLRDFSFPQEKPQGQTRILVLGNSTTFGAGVAQEETYPHQLQNLLAESGRDFLVINAGGQGASPAEAIGFLDNRGLAFEPDIIIFGFSPSMIARTANISGGNSGKKQSLPVRTKKAVRKCLMKAHTFLHGSVTYVSFDYFVRKSLYRLGVIEDDLGKTKGAVYAYAFDAPGVDIEQVEAGYNNMKLLLKELWETARNHNIKLAITAIPSQFEISDLPRDNPRRFPLSKVRIQPTSRLKRFAEEIGIPYIDAAVALKEQCESSADPLYVPADYSHLNKQGLCIISGSIRSFLINEKWL